MIPTEKEFNCKEKQFPKKGIVFHKMYNGLHWRYFNKNNENLSIVCHDGSYGHESGYFEIYPSWTDEENENWGDSVKGYCTFGEVQHWIDKLNKRG